MWVSAHWLIPHEVGRPYYVCTDYSSQQENGTAEMLRTEPVQFSTQTGRMGSLTSSSYLENKKECRALPFVYRIRLILTDIFQHHLRINAFTKLQRLHLWYDKKINRWLLSYYNEELVRRDYIHYRKWFTSYKSLLWGFNFPLAGSATHSVTAILEMKVWNISHM